MLEEWPLEELPAARVRECRRQRHAAQTNSARRMRQFINRLDIALPACTSRELNVA
jgi:hypothetical protein